MAAADLPAAVLRHFLRDIENHLLTESLPEARESLGDWILRSQKNTELTEAAKKDSRELDEWLHDKTLRRREAKTGESPHEWLLIEAISQDKTLVRRSEEEQQQHDETLSKLTVFRKECDRQLAELSRRAELLERKKQAILRRVTLQFYGYSRTRRELLRPYAKDFASEEARRQVAQQIGDRICPETSPESKAATRAAEIIKLGKRHGIDDERVASWISGGISLDAISAEILDELASRSAQPATSAATKTPAPRTDGNKSGLYDRELADVFRLGIRGRVDRDRIAESIEKYWTPELTAAEFIAGVSGLRRLKARADKRSVVGEIFELFGEPEGAWAWKDAYVQRLLSDLEQLAEGATLESEPAPAAVPVIEDPTADVQVDASSSAELEPAATPGPEADPPAKIPEPPIPAEIAEPVTTEAIAPKEQTGAAQEAADGIATLLRSPWKRFIADIMLDHPDYSNKEICDAADRRRNSRKEGETRRELAPPVSWMKASGETRRPEEWLLDEALWARVYDNDESRHALESEFSKIRRKVKLEPRRTA